jgi:hypothetical protein
MWSLLKKVLKRKNNNMENIEEIDVEFLDRELKPFLYKWAKGDNSGTVCEYESVFKDPTTGIIWINFKGGTRINYALLNEYMMQIDSSSIVHNEPVAQNNNLPVKNVMLSESKAKVPDLENPIVSLLQKQKPNWVEVGINLKLNLPTKNLYNVLTSSFDDAEEEIIEFVVRDLDIEIIKESLRINIKDIYKSNGTLRKGGTISNTKNEE